MSWGVHSFLSYHTPPSRHMHGQSLSLSPPHMHTHTHVHASYKGHPTSMIPESSWGLQNRSLSVPQGLTASPQISGLDSREHRERLAEFSDEVKL